MLELDFFRAVVLTNVRTVLMSKVRTERGASAVEYGLLVAGIAALIVAVVFLLGGVVKGAFSSTCGTISSQGGSGTC